MSLGDRNSMFRLVTGLLALLGLAAAAVTIFVTRLEYMDMARRVTRMEEAVFEPRKPFHRTTEDKELWPDSLPAESGSDQDEKVFGKHSGRGLTLNSPPFTVTGEQAPCPAQNVVQEADSTQNREFRNLWEGRLH